MLKSSVKFVGILALCLLVGCSTRPTIEELEAEALDTGDWSAVEKRQRMDEKWGVVKSDSACRGDKVEIKDMFGAFRNYINAVFASLLVGVIVAFGLVLLIVPGIIFACKLAFTPYLVVDRKMDAIEAIKTSWHMTDGYAWDVFLIGVMAIPICFAGILALPVRR